jgi:hypothetical protein
MRKWRLLLGVLVWAGVAAAMAGRAAPGQGDSPEGAPAPVPAPGPADDADAASVSAAGDAPDPQHYLLRYGFQPGETVRWEVTHQSHVRTNISGTEQTAESLTTSVKTWQVSEVDAEGNVTFVYSIESVRMRQKITRRQELTYDSTTDATPPPAFEGTAALVGKPLVTLTMDARGQVLRREDLVERAGGTEQDQLTMTLPEAAVAVGGQWSFPEEIVVRLREGGTRRIRVRQQGTLEAVENGVAVLRMQTQIITPLSDPEVEAQLVQRETSGTVRFDIDQGRIVAQQIDVDKQVHEFSGPESLMHCRTRFVERLLGDAPPTARVD